MTEDSDYASCGSNGSGNNALKKVSIPFVSGKYDYESPVITGPSIGQAAAQQRAKADS